MLDTKKSPPPIVSVDHLKIELLRKLEAIEGVIAKPSSVAGGTALFFRGREFGHFHHDRELDLRLTKKVIQAMALKHPEGSVHHPSRSVSSPWIEVRYEDAAGVQQAVELVCVAIKQL